MPDPSELFTSAQAAQYLGLSRQRVSLAAKNGKIGTLYGRNYLFTKAELDAFKVAPKPKGGRPRKPTSPVGDGFVTHIDTTEAPC